MEDADADEGRDGRPGHEMIARRRFHRAVFVAAGLYNMAWGLWAIVDPQWLFRFTGMPLANQPAIFACLGMVVGLYGILYLEVARFPERGWMIAAVGLLGSRQPLSGMILADPNGMGPVRLRPVPYQRRDLVDPVLRDRDDALAPKAQSLKPKA
jgi:hypothetical protein